MEMERPNANNTRAYIAESDLNGQQVAPDATHFGHGSCRPFQLTVVFERSECMSFMRVESFP